MEGLLHMKNSAMVAILLLIGSYGLAADLKVNVEGRVDNVNQSNVTTAQSGGAALSTKNENSFKVDRVRVNAVGKVNDQFSYRVRFNLTNTVASVSGTSTQANRDSTSNQVDLMYVDDKVMDNLTIRAGKQLYLEAVGWESFYPGSDTFTYSTTFNTNNTNYGLYRTGASAIYTVAGQRFTFGITNATKPGTLPDSTGGSQINYGTAYGLYYTGSFWDGKLIPIIGYTQYPQDGDVDAATPTNTVNDTLMVYGLRVAPIPDLLVDVANETLTQPFKTANATGSDTKTTSLVARAQYKINALIPFVNYISDNFSNTSTPATIATQFQRTAYDVGVWYYPYQDVNFRYQLVYTNDVKTWDTTSTNGKTTINTVWLGMKFDI